MRFALKTVLALLLVSPASAAEYHVAKTGNDNNPGTEQRPFLTISAAAEKAMPGDTITVHEGIYRERVNPPRGGTSDRMRIVYQAAPGEKVTITGAEVVKNWTRVQDNVWKVTIPNTFFGDFNPYNDLIRGDWFRDNGRDHHTGAVHLNGHWLTEAARLEEVLESKGEPALWFGQVEDTHTTIWAQFKDVNPNEELVEINVRQTVFYPDQPGRNYITVRGFTLCQAATPWAPPTAEQIGLIGTHWSKGWIIENNTVQYSTCSGITLGKYGDEFDNTSANTAEGYVETIKRALAYRIPWSKEHIGGHIVRDNHISHCEQGGIIGSMGCAFSTVTGNVIHDTHVRQLFSGAEMSAIKFHGAIDVLISHNHIFRNRRGIWLDWMTQGTRVTRNLLHDNDWTMDLFVEVNHGPFLVDNNIFLSRATLLDNSQGGAYVHNLIAGKVTKARGGKRRTPYLEPHGTAIAGLHGIPIGDSRFYNNLLVGPADLGAYDQAKLPMFMSGNVFLGGARPGANEVSPLVLPDFDPGIKLIEKDDGWYLDVTLDKAWAKNRKRDLVTGALLGRTAVSDLPFENADGTPVRVDTDYLGTKRSKGNPFPGPFARPAHGRQLIKVW